jgi:hypothetical protein
VKGSSRELRVARNHALFREVNERIYALTEEFGTHPAADGLELAVVCECGSADCASEVLIETADYARIRSHAARFIVLTGHELSEPVVESGHGYLVVEQRRPAPVEA